MTHMTENVPLAVIAIRQVEKSTGASRNAIEQAGALVELGYRVVILAERGQPALVWQHGAELVRLWRWPLKGPCRRFWFNRRVQAWVRRHRPELLISHGDCETPDAVYLHNCVHLASEYIHGAKLPRRHEVAAIHDHVLKGGGFRQVAVNSRLMGQDLIERYGVDPDKIEISYPGYDPEQFNLERAKAGRSEARRLLGVGDAEYLVGLVTSGNFTKRNVSGFIDMAAELNQRHPGKYRFLIVGKDDASPYREQAKTKEVERRIIWRSTVPNVEALYGALDLFVLPAHIEEFGRVVIEAMACGTPVLVSERVGASELFTERHPDLVMRYEASSQEWALRIELLLEGDPDSIGNEMIRQVQPYSYVEQRKKLKSSLQRLTMNAL